MQDFREYLNVLYPISDESYELIQNEITVTDVAKGTILCDIDTTPTNVYFILSGFIRAYTIDKKGKEYTKSLFNRFQFAGSFSALIKNEKSNNVYTAVTPCKMLVFNYKNLTKLSEKHLDIANLSIKMHELFYVSMENKLLEFTTKDATERYKNLISGFEHIERIIPQYQIATILGITPIQLSRIRKKISDELW